MTNPSTTDFRALCAELADSLEEWLSSNSIGGISLDDGTDAELIFRARAALAQPEPQGPTDEELDELFTEIDQSGESESWRSYARAVLARWGRPAVEPVPVSERLPGPEDCDAEGRCWMFGKVEGDWRLISTINPGLPRLRYCFSHWLPHHALPVPQQEVDCG
jgi:hypothetical protein